MTTYADEDAGIGVLGTTRGNLPLEEIDVRAAITGLAVRTELTQVFHNPFPEPLEASYIFPLPDRSAVTALRMEAGDRVVEGVLKERAEARADYDTAVAEGKRASIAEEERPGVFTMRVGNIMPGERVVVRLTLTGLLPYEDGEAAFRFPLVVAPRYIPGAPRTGSQTGDGVQSDTDAVPDASRISPPVLLPNFPNPVRLSVQVDVDPGGLPLNDIRSSLPITTVGRTVRLDPGERANQDFVLRLSLGDKESISTSLTTLRDKDGGTFALTVLPPNTTVQSKPRDVVLVLDRSGSMAGWKMVTARRAAARIVDTLAPTDRFAVLTFDNQVETPQGLPTGLVPSTDRNRFRAVEHLAGLTARGGTEMLAPLRQAADLLPESERERVLVLVTDGQVGNEDQILHTLAPRLGGIRVHTVGVDTAVNEAFLRRLSALRGGRCELVESEDRLDEAMQNIHHRIHTPLVTGLHLHSDDLNLETIAPERLPDLFAGAPVVITGRFRGKAEGSITVEGSGWRTTATATPSTNASLASVWARARIRDLEDRYVTANQDLDDLEKEIVRTSLDFKVLSRFTAFLAVDDQVVNEGGSVHRVLQPVETPRGWESMPMFAAAPAAYAPRANFARTEKRAPSPEPEPLAEVREFAAAELITLKSFQDKAGGLARLMRAIEARIEHFRTEGLAEPWLRLLRDLMAELSGPVGDPAEVEHRWLRAVDVLEALSPQKPFWKR